jgi:uncharacterized protein (TIGR03083 family)
MIRDWIAAERRGLADVLGGLTPEQWVAPSLCDGWTVAHVAAHVTMPFRYSSARFLLELARARGDFHAVNERVATRDHVLPHAELVAALRDNAQHPWRPPGAGWDAPLTHDVVHGLDVTRALGIDRDPATEALRVVLDGLATPRSAKYFGVSFAGAALRATDLDWSCGEGLPLAGRGADLVLLLSGRPVAAAAFEGDGAGLVAGARVGAAG